MSELSQSGIDYYLSEAELCADNLEYSMEMYLAAERIAESKEMDPVTERGIENTRETIIDEFEEEIIRRSGEITDYELDGVDDAVELWDNILKLENIADKEELGSEYREAKTNLAEAYEATHNMSLAILNNEVQDIPENPVNHNDTVREILVRANDYEFFSKMMADHLDETHPTDSYSFDSGEVLETLDDILIDVAEDLTSVDDRIAEKVVEEVEILAEQYGVTDDIIVETSEKAQMIWEIESRLERLDESSKNIKIHMKEEEVSSEKLEDYNEIMDQKISEVRTKIRQSDLGGELENLYIEQLNFIENSITL